MRLSLRFKCFFIKSVVLAKICQKQVPGAQENCFLYYCLINLQFLKKLQVKWHRRHGITKSMTPRQQSAGSTVGKIVGGSARCWGSSPHFCSFIFLCACVVRGRSMRTSISGINFPGTTWVMIPKSITSSLIPEFIEALYARPWLLPCGTESWLARTPWVLGLFSGRGKTACTLRGEPVNVLSRKGKEDCRELLTVLAVNLKENYLLDPCVDF